MILVTLLCLFPLAAMDGVEDDLGPGNSTRQRVVIIGGGIAGCAAAWHLKRSIGDDIQLTILEAGNRLGGRISTIDLKGDETVPDSKVELGANWIHGTEGNPLHDFLVERDLMVRADEIEGEWIGLTDDGERIPDDLEAKAERFEVRLENERIAFSRENEEPSGEDADDDAGKFTRRYFERRLFAEAESEEERSMLEKYARHANLVESNAWGCDDLNQVSLANYGSFTESEGDDIPLKNGFGAVIDFFAETLDEEEIILNSTVDVIAWNGAKVEDVRVILKNGRVVSADFILVTVSVGCLKARRPKFQPPLPARKLVAIDRFGYGTVDKIFVRLDAEQRAALIGAVGEENTAGVYFLWSEGVDTENLTDSWVRGFEGLQFVRRDLILLWLHGVEARFVEDIDDDVVSEALDRLFSRFLGTKLGTFRHPRRLIRTRWHANEFTRGSYSFPAKGAPMDDFEALGEPIYETIRGIHTPRIMFAGEATHPYYYSTTHGAFESGIREAKRLTRHLVANGAGKVRKSISDLLGLSLFTLVVALSSLMIL